MTKISVILTPKSVQALNVLHAKSPDTRVDVINRAIQLYERLYEALEGDGSLYISESGDASLRRITVR